MSTKVALEALNRHLPSRLDIFVCSASFESRCVSIATQLANRAEKGVIIRTGEYISSSDKNFRTLKDLFVNDLVEALVSSSSATVTADALAAAVVAPMKALHSGNVFIDITTFTHEQLLILLALIKREALRCTVYCGYTGAAEYSINTDEADVWLSRGVRQLRSVLGYPGAMAPSKKLHLLVLVGFESERAQALIEKMEPSRLSLGIGNEAQSVSSDHYVRNERFFNRLRSFLATQTRVQAEVDIFSFSCIDPYEACAAVLDQAKKYPAFNTVICPMNTKISTVGSGLAALLAPELQLVYASAEDYNETGYSSASEEVRVFTL